jgi:hypothetical protein
VIGGEEHAVGADMHPLHRVLQRAAQVRAIIGLGVAQDGLEHALGIIGPGARDRRQLALDRFGQRRQWQIVAIDRHRLGGDGRELGPRRRRGAADDRQRQERSSRHGAHCSRLGG